MAVPDKALLDSVVFYCPELGQQVSVRQYFAAIVLRLWTEGEDFSGKRPLGNSGWHYDLWAPLVKAGALRGTVDEYGDVRGGDRDEYEDFVEALIKEL